MNFIISNSMNIVLFTALFITICLIALYGSRGNKDSKFISGIPLVIILLYSIPAGFRGLTVGLDTGNYYYLISNINNEFNPQIMRYEVGFRILIKSLMYIFNEPTFVMFSLALITHFFIVISFWKLRENVNFCLLNIGYIVLYYFETFNIMRQWLAISIILYVFVLALKNKYFQAICLVILAALIHKVTIIGILIVAFSYIIDTRTNKKIKYFLLFGIILLIFNATTIFQFLQTNTEVGYLTDRYFSETKIDSGIGVFWYIRLSTIILLIIGNKRYLNTANNIVLNNIIVLMSLGLLLNTFGYFFDFMDRIGKTYSVFEIYGLAILAVNHKNIVIRIFVMLIYFALYLKGITSSSQGQFPFYFIDYFY